MSLIVAVHGIGQQFKGPSVLHSEWCPPLRDGLAAAGVDLKDSDLVCPFYGKLFRPPGTKASALIPYDANDVTEEYEKELLEEWWREAARVEQNVPGPGDSTKGTSRSVQRALNALSYSKFFASIAESFEEYIIADLKQVTSFFRDPAIREQICAQVIEAVHPADTRVIVAHSLGSVVAYECLCAHPEWNVKTLVTLGSPLGIRNLVFDRLKPPPLDGRGAWPGSVVRWINIADEGDIVALMKPLGTCFGNKVEDHIVNNGADAHSVSHYLTAEVTGHAIASGLR
jgi:hypothetical protein